MMATQSEGVIGEHTPTSQFSRSHSNIFIYSDRRLRPSDSSVENDSIAYTYTQRFSKMPTESDQKAQPNRITASNNDAETNRETNSSDTENASPAMPIGPKDVSSVSLKQTPFQNNYIIDLMHVYSGAFTVRGREL